MRVGVIECGGNLTSVVNALTRVGAAVKRVGDPSAIGDLDRLVLPGVGSFARTMDRLHDGGFIEAIRRYAAERRGWLLGICVGMQVLADRGTEFGDREGLGLVPGVVTKLDTRATGERLPHMGWNAVSVVNGCPLLRGLDDPTFYFVHSYRFDAARKEHVAGWCDYAGRFCAAIQRQNVYGVQFHPEKSQADGLRLLGNFVNGVD